MGLPLFIAPVESDIPSKPVAKSPADPATARSPIRRSDRRRQLNETREHRLRLLAALQGNISLPDHESGSPPETRPRPTENEAPSSLGTARFAEPSSLDFDDEAMIDMISAEAFRGRRDALRSNPTLPGADGSVQEESYLRGDLSYVSWHDAQYFRDPPSQQIQIGGARSRDASSRRMRFSSDLDMGFTPRPRPTVIRRQSSNDSMAAGRAPRSRNPDPAEYLEEYRRRRNLQAPSAPTPPGRYRPQRPVRSVRYMDGLGDRDRSLSPEGDSVWDTLQSTLTPDPQPPSVGSSFASTNASAAASQTTASSSNTSITNPDEEVEPPCDPVAENLLDTDDDGDEEAEEHPTETSRRPTPHSERRSYADVVAALPAGDDRTERLEWLSDMQRIVQGLASRQDIPDQWWAAAGLSRSMTSG